MRLDPMFCMICDKDKRSAGHNQVEVKWSNGSIMPIGLCTDCGLNHKHDTPEGKKLIQEWHWAYWDKHGGRYDKGVTIA